MSFLVICDISWRVTILSFIDNYVTQKQTAFWRTDSIHFTCVPAEISLIDYCRALVGQVQQQNINRHVNKKSSGANK